jgi:protoheme IX farnesyltransferase
LRSFLTRIFPELIRINITLFVTLSAFAAEVLVLGRISINLIYSLTGIFLLACGASVLNQVQEKEQDAKMDRTKNRPVPSERLSSQMALLIAFILFFFGFVILSSGFHWTCLILGILNILWYNGFYTWLKKKTAFAVVPGAISGVIPVFMGWSAGGGSLFDIPVLLLAFFLFIWQIPHFWLLMLKYGDEYRIAGFPVMTDIFNIRQFRNIILAWMIGATGTSLFLVFSGIWILLFSKIIILVLNLLILGFFFQQLVFSENPRYRVMFITMNAFLFVVLSLVILEKVFS